MKNALRLTGGLLVVIALALATSPAKAQTTANGFYYPTPSWDQTFACTTKANCPRFVVLSNFGSAAVLDRETGLVWEQSPGDTNGDGRVDDTDREDWFAAQSRCNDKNVSGRKGWRLPTIQELASLVNPDPSVPFPGPMLPPGHPFSNVQPSIHWSATTSPGTSPTSHAWNVDFFRIGLGRVGADDKTMVHFVWCVRGGQGVDPQ